MLGIAGESRSVVSGCHQMSAREHGGSAFPVVENFDELRGETIMYPQSGMTMRDYFAARAMQGMFASDTDQQPVVQEHFPFRANAAYAMADAMLAERAK